MAPPDRVWVRIPAASFHLWRCPRAGRQASSLRALIVIALVIASMASRMARAADADGGFIHGSRRIAPGLVFERLVSRHPSIRAFVLRIGLAAPLTIDVALADSRYPGYRTIKRIAEDHGAIAAINGDLALEGRPLHPFVRNGQLIQSGVRSGHAFGATVDGSLVHIGRARPRASVVSAIGTATIREWNSGVPAGGSLAAFTPVGGRVEFPPTNACSAALSAASGVMDGVRPYEFQQEYLVRHVACDRPISVSKGMALSARLGGDGAEWLTSLTPGQRVRVGWSVGWTGVLDLQGGNPLLVKDGRVVAPRHCHPTFCGRHPRSGVGAMPGCLDAPASTPCTVLYVVVDGRQRGWSSGMTLVAFARLFRHLGAASALNVDGGASSTMVVGGRVVNRPSEGSLRAVESAMLVVPNQSTDGVPAVRSGEVCRADRLCRL
jgi:phosphodiester glycosidase